METDFFASNRLAMVRDQIERRGVSDPLVLKAMRNTPRHQFFSYSHPEDAYADYPSPIGFQQTISQPYIVALMSSLLQLKGSEQVLEIGTGSGYQAAILSQIAARVISLEIIPQLAVHARRTLSSLGYHNVEILQQDGSGGYPAQQPYGGILVSACAPSLPAPLLEQLSPGARVVIPVANSTGQILQIWEKDLLGNLTVINHIPVAFVPLYGEYGYTE